MFPYVIYIYIFVGPYHPDRGAARGRPDLFDFPWRHKVEPAGSQAPRHLTSRFPGKEYKIQLNN